MDVDSTVGSSLAQVVFTFEVMIPHEPYFVAPLPTEIPDYVWSHKYDKPCFLPGRPVRKPKDTSRRISHPDAESALRAAKRACYKHPGRWFGRSSDCSAGAVFLVYEDGKVVERHVVESR